jgi:FKBP-type peptidyl-prolyl cis-trans isomerase
MFNKFELIAGGISIGCMALALYLVQINTTGLALSGTSQVGQVATSDIIVVGEGPNVTQERADALYEAVDTSGKLARMVIDDITKGIGDAVKSGDKVSVHYVGTLQDGTEFDNSKKRGTAFDFTVGGGQVIKGWDEGLVGMQVGGQRILVIPPDFAYGANGIGPIPGNATLVFSIELLTIN